MENISPQEFLKQKFKSPLFLALTISFFASIILQLIQNIINIVKGPIVYNLSELGQEIPEEMIDAFDQSYVAGFIVSSIISIIILIPSIIIAFGFLKLYFLGTGRENKPTGFKLIRAYAKFRIILLYIILGFTGTFFVVLLLSLLVLAPFVIFIVFLLLYGIIFGVVMLVLNYYRKIYMLTFNLEKTYYTNKNTSYIFKLVLVLLIINAVLSLNLSVDLISFFLMLTKGFSFIVVIILLFKYRKQFGSGIPEGAVVKYKDAVNEAKTQEFQDAYKNMVIVDDEPNYLIDNFNPMDFNYEWKDTQNYSEEYNAGLPLQISKSTLYYEFKKDLYFVNFEITKNYGNIQSLSLSFMFKDKDARIIKVYNSEKFLLQNNNISHYLLKVPNGASMVSISIDSIYFDNDLSWNGKSNTYHFFWNK